MQPTLTEEINNDQPVAPKRCINCESEAILPGYTNALCSNCRQHFLKFPFPLWIKAFGAGIGIVVLFSLFSFVENLQTGIHMEKGLKAEKDHKFLTAQREYEQVLKKVPGHVEAKVHLLIAAFYNDDFPTMAVSAQELEGTTVEDEELFDRAKHVMDLNSLFFASDSLNALYTQYKDAAPELHSTVVKDYYRHHPEDASAALKVANNAIESKDFPLADSVLQLIIRNEPENTAAISLLSAVKRYQKDANAALKYLDQLLAVNKENLYALSSKARVLVMLNKDKDALELAKKADKLDNQFIFNKATLAIVYHYLGDKKERDQILNKAKAKNDSLTMAYMQYAIDIAENQETLRN